MFTGCIDSTGIISQIQKRPQALSLTIIPDITPYDSVPGDSIAINGVCLTVESISGNKLFFTAVRETLLKTTLETAAAGVRVNLERAVKLSGRMGGHFVLGHVDGVGRVVRDVPAGVSTVRTIWIPRELRALTPPKGSIAIDGVSLTIAGADEETISVSLIPFTKSSTTLGTACSGKMVNIECDVIARYIRHLLVRGESGTAGDTPVQDTDLLKKLELNGF